jgi:hypothetical protein
VNASGRDPTWASACGESHRWDGIVKVKERGVRFGRKPRLVPEKMDLIRELSAEGMTVSHIIRETEFSKARISSMYSARPAYPAYTEPLQETLALGVEQLGRMTCLNLWQNSCLGPA